MYMIQKYIDLVHFNDSVLYIIQMAAMVKYFGLKESNFLRGYFQRLSNWKSQQNYQLNAYACFKRQTPSHRDFDVKQPFFLRMDCPNFKTLLKMNSLTPNNINNNNKINKILY